MPNWKKYDYVLPDYPDWVTNENSFYELNSTDIALLKALLVIAALSFLWVYLKKPSEKNYK